MFLFLFSIPLKVMCLFFHLASFDFIFGFQQFDYGVLRNVCVCACVRVCVCVCASMCIYSVLEFLAGHLSSVLENS